MKKDIDLFMKKNDVNAIVATGSANNDSIMYYLLNGVNITALFIKKYGRPAYIIHSAIEREEAMKTKLKSIGWEKFGINDIFGKYKDRIKANAVLFDTVLRHFKVKGRVAFYGNASLGYGYNFLKQLRMINKRIEILYEPEKSLITQVRMAKDKQEIERIKRVRNGVISAFDKTIEWARKMKVRNGTIYKDKKRKLLIRDLKKHISDELFRLGFVNSSGLIISQGRDAGVPHNSGKDNEPVKTGKTIVFDIFPQEIGGGYYFDFTRTVCFGFASDNIKKEYEQVKQAQDIAFENLRIGRRTREVEKAVCKYFERNKHPTFLNYPGVQKGYCHSLGHGLGLNVHENPVFGLLKTNMDRLEKGMVFTIEPGLYYPEKGYGIRLEDVVYIDLRGRVINLTRYPRNLVVEM
ncbi:MAG: Xaa-Pro peptidase family protein [candidate division WOR-3 bacterium]